MNGLNLYEQGAVIKKATPLNQDAIIVDLEMNNSVTRHVIGVNFDAETDEHGNWCDLSSVVSVDGVAITPEVEGLAAELYAELAMEVRD